MILLKGAIITKFSYKFTLKSIKPCVIHLLPNRAPIVALAALGWVFYFRHHKQKIQIHSVSA